MADQSTKGRRQFLKNSSLAALSAALLPGMKASAQSTAAEEQALCNPTTLDYYGQGPFYTPDTPDIMDNQLAPEAEPGTRLVITGRVMDLGCDTFLPGTTLDIWHADHEGAYDNQGYHLRGKTVSNAQGFYMFETILPGKYLNGAQYRPSHIHFKVTPPGYPELTTQLYFEGDEHIPVDAAASISSGTYDASDRIIPLIENDNGVLEGVWDIVVDGDGVTSISDLHREKGMIYSVDPNPFTDTLSIKYGVFLAAEVSIEVFDMQGRTVATLASDQLNPDKYEAQWTPSAYTPRGTFFIALKVNDLQVHYLKVVRQ